MCTGTACVLIGDASGAPGRAATAGVVAASSSDESTSLHVWRGMSDSKSVGSWRASLPSSSAAGGYSGANCLLTPRSSSTTSRRCRASSASARPSHQVANQGLAVLQGQRAIVAGVEEGWRQCVRSGGRSGGCAGRTEQKLQHRNALIELKRLREPLCCTALHACALEGGTSRKRAASWRSASALASCACTSSLTASLNKFDEN